MDLNEIIGGQISRQGYSRLISLHKADGNETIMKTF